MDIGTEAVRLVFGVMGSGFIGCLVLIGVRGYLDERTKRRSRSETVLTEPEVEKKIHFLKTDIEKMCSERQKHCADLVKAGQEVVIIKFVQQVKTLEEHFHNLSILVKNREAQSEKFKEEVHGLTLKLDTVQKSIDKLNE